MLTKIPPGISLASHYISHFLNLFCVAALIVCGPPMRVLAWGLPPSRAWLLAKERTCWGNHDPIGKKILRHAGVVGHHNQLLPDDIHTDLQGYCTSTEADYQGTESSNQFATHKISSDMISADLLVPRLHILPGLVDSGPFETAQIPGQ